MRLTLSARFILVATVLIGLFGLAAHVQRLLGLQVILVILEEVMVATAVHACLECVDLARVLRNLAHGTRRVEIVLKSLKWRGVDRAILAYDLIECWDLAWEHC